MADYTKLEYIESTGTQYIDTGFGTEHTIKLDIQFINNGAPQQLMGQGTSAGYYFGIKDSGYLENGKSDEFSYLGTERRTINITCVDKNQVMTVGNETKIVGRGTSSASTFKLLGGIANYPCSAKLYSCQFYDDETIIRDFVPCKTADGEIGLWDTVEGKFYGNAGTGTFVAGPEVIVPVEPADPPNPTAMLMGYMVGQRT